MQFQNDNLPLNYRTTFNNLNTGLVHYKDYDCISVEALDETQTSPTQTSIDARQINSSQKTYINTNWTRFQ